MDSGIDALLFFGGEQRNGVTEAGEDLRDWPQGSVDSFKRKLAVWRGACRGILLKRGLASWAGDHERRGRLRISQIVEQSDFCRETSLRLALGQLSAEIRHVQI